MRIRRLSVYGRLLHGLLLISGRSLILRLRGSGGKPVRTLVLVLVLALVLVIRVLRAVLVRDDYLPALLRSN